MDVSMRYVYVLCDTNAGRQKFIISQLLSLVTVFFVIKFRCIQPKRVRNMSGGKKLKMTKFKWEVRGEIADVRRMDLMEISSKKLNKLLLAAVLYMVALQQER